MSLKKLCYVATLLAALGGAQLANAGKTYTIPVNLIDANGQGASVGTVTAEMYQGKAGHGVLFTPNLHNLPAGVHGFHVHMNPSCAPENGVPGGAAGGHLDPGKTGMHNGPYAEKGHLGDLPVLIVNQDGTATLPVLAPKLSMQDLKDRSLMIHAGGDNYSDTPEKLGGGGARVACGVIQ